MKTESLHIRSTYPLAVLAALSVLLSGAASAQVPVDAEGNPISPLNGGVNVENPLGSEGPLQSPAELETLVGPIALYPDDLLAIVLPASTYPLEIVQAARFLEQVEANPSLKPDPEWDESVTALLNYPEVVKLMDDDIDWTWKLGEAVVAQQADVIAAVESFRDRAYAAGNLKSDEYQNVTVDDGVIEIEPVNEDIIYVPYYEPERVVVYSPRPVYYYYPRPYPVYYYPYPAGHYFTSQFFWGVTTAFTIGWSTDHLHVYHPSYYGHPYYGYTYYGSYWRRPSINVYNTYYVNNHVTVSRDHYRSGDYWRPRHRGGARPGHYESRDTYYSDRNREQLSNSYRDQRTSGLAYTNTSQRQAAAGVDRSTPRTTTGTSSRRNDQRIADSRRSNRGSETGRSSDATAGRPEIEFRPRNDQAQSGSAARRLERSADNGSARQANRGTANSSGQSTNRNAAGTSNRPAGRASANSGGSNDAIRFRSRETSGGRNAVAQTSGRTTTAPTENRRRTTVAANERSTAVGNVSRGSSSTPAPSTRNRATPARSTVQSRPAPVRSQPAATEASRAPASRPASPARTERPSVDRSSSRSSGSSADSRRSGNSGGASSRRERR